MEKLFLAATDFSENSVQALLYAIDLAEKHEAKLIFFHNANVHIPETTPSETYQKIADSYAIEYRQKLADHVEKVYEQAGRKSNPENSELLISIDSLHTSALIKRLVKERNIKAVILGTRGYSGIKRILLGSTSRQLLRSADFPLVVVPMGCTYKDINKVLCISSKENFSEELQRVVEFARLFDAEAAILHLQDSDNEIANPDELVKTERSRLNYQKINLYAYPKENRDTSEQICDLAKLIDAAVVVMFTEKRNFWQRLFEEYETKEVLKYLEVPLIAINN
jgi:nucleotide-binding universal stress UspA family protein